MMRASLVLACAGTLFAQEPNPTQHIPERTGATFQQDTSGATPIYKVTVVSRTARAINYRHRSGATKIDFRGTELLPQARGEAKVESKQGYIEIEVEFDNLEPASRYGPEYLTYVMWAVTPEGRATNLGEVLLNGTKSKLDVTTELQAFALIVTAEPYFAVTQPSDVVVMENVVRPDTKGKIEEVDAKYELLQRGEYHLSQDVRTLRPMALDPKVPIELYEARNALQIAKWAQADKYASDSYTKAEHLLNDAEVYENRKAGRKPVAMTAREAVQTFEDARVIALRKHREEQLAMERQAAADREAAAQAQAAHEAQQRAQAEADRQAAAEREAAAQAQAAREAQQRAQAETDRQAAEQAKAEALAAAQQAERMKAEADQARAQAEQARQAAVAEQQRLASEAQKAQQQAQEADRMRQQAEADRERIRQELLQQLNMVLETRESARGLIVNMSDVLFDFGKSTLKPGAREKLAKIAGIVLAHPGLNLEVEGHTDSIGSDQFNQRLSEARADAVRDYLIAQGLKTDAITARGLGKSQPVASNDSAEGRQRNRRVELVVSGDIIGTKIESMRLQAQPAAPPQSSPQVPPR